VEVTFVNGVALPPLTQWGEGAAGPWQSLFGTPGARVKTPESNALQA